MDAVGADEAGPADEERPALVDDERIRIVLHGKAAGVEAIRDAVLALRHEGHAVEVRVTWEAGDTIRMAQEAVRDGVGALVAGGGDGTLSELVDGLLLEEEGGRPRRGVGVLPYGTANDFATACGIPRDDPLAALRLVAEGRPRLIDVGRLGDRAFVNVATAGFGATVTHETPDDLKRLLGGAAYLLTGLTRFGGIGAEHGRFLAPGFGWEGNFYGLAVGNGRLAGGGFAVCPDALLDDGLLDVAILPEVPVGDLLHVLGGFLGDDPEAVRDEVIYLRVPWLEVTAPPRGLHVNLDGEPIDGTAFRFEAMPRRLPFFLPPSAPLVGHAGAPGAHGPPNAPGDAAPG
jgi:lipid kinase YegS